MRVSAPRHPGALSLGACLAAAALLVLLTAAWGRCAEADESGEVWGMLAMRLRTEGGCDPAAVISLIALPPPSPEPMGRKVKELYYSKYIRPTLKLPPKRLPPLYPNVATAENAVRCREYIAAHRAAFDGASRRYGVPSEITAALLFVETRLGTAVGKYPVMYTLASMAVTQQPYQLGGWLEGLDVGDERSAWLDDVLRKRSAWAYNELRTFLTYCHGNGIDPLAVYGSFYGAFGICQFMPTSVSPYAADGNGDGAIDLFVVDDAVASVGRYLSLNGWKAAGPRKVWHAALKRYNREDRYANTILALADLVRTSGTPAKPPAQPKAKRKASVRK